MIPFVIEKDNPIDCASFNMGIQHFMEISCVTYKSYESGMKQNRFFGVMFCYVLCQKFFIVLCSVML